MSALRQALRAYGRAARTASGKSLAAQVAEMIVLRNGVGRLSPEEYYQYGLYDDRRFSREQKRAFFGRQMEYDLWRRLDAWAWHAIAHDKLVFYTLLGALGFPVPAVKAIYHPRRSHGAVAALSSGEALGDWLRGRAPYPLVAKPITGIGGRNIFAVNAWEPVADTLSLANGDGIPVEDFIARLGAMEDKGFLFQELLVPDAELHALCGASICTVRLVVILRDEPRLILARWRIATGRNMADNFWQPGNMHAVVDPETGRVGPICRGLGLERVELSDHPDTGRRLAGATLPGWTAARELCLRAAACLPGLKMQAWDVALTERGPVLLEVNIIGGMRLAQSPAAAGIYHGEFREFLEEQGVSL